MAAWIDVFSMVIVEGLMWSSMRIGLISYRVKASYPWSLGLMGSTFDMINEEGNEVRDHSSTVGCNIVSTILSTLG